MTSVRALQVNAREISLGPLPGGLLAASFAVWSALGLGHVTCYLCMMRSDRSDQRDNVSSTSGPPIYGQRPPPIDRQGTQSSTQALVYSRLR
ncbi:uncharacterized protein EURHEDRAFT_206201 [Aspergillus ruber CBS 135680]|uniref:Uncharacterized protein n=1 Tax=Aspergillus ruber (strain CBS 135680) TaxID=1388766 RepID=A0A017SPW6_ASPRC|nr:uncharacterized protein EURHEDRAFT_206201 [Aspergillus ruber CBS 135680]EYE98315.1 hypothetical protein EURHEDRAFT_206201 [Aspergillus ruber CBS 135680]